MARAEASLQDLPEKPGRPEMSESFQSRRTWRPREDLIRTTWPAGFDWVEASDDDDGALNSSTRAGAARWTGIGTVTAAFAASANLLFSLV